MSGIIPVDLETNQTLVNVDTNVNLNEITVHVDSNINMRNVNVSAEIQKPTILVDITRARDAYQIAVQHGYSGTRQQWIASLSSDLSYTHTQSNPSTIWTVNHQLGKRPAVHVEDSAGTEQYGDINHSDSSSLIISFASAFGGIAVCN